MLQKKKEQRGYFSRALWSEAELTPEEQKKAEDEYRATLESHKKAQVEEKEINPEESKHIAKFNVVFSLDVFKVGLIDNAEN